MLGPATGMGPWSQQRQRSFAACQHVSVRASKYLVHQEAHKFECRTSSIVVFPAPAYVFDFGLNMGDDFSRSSW